MSVNQLQLNKKQEGDRAYAEAQKCLQTGLFKWKPDFNGATKHLQTAAIAYKNAKLPELAMKTYLELAKAQLQSEFGTDFSAGKSYELAGNCALELQQFDKAFSLYDTAAKHYITAGELEKTGELYVSSARAIQSIDPAKAAGQMKKSLKYYEAEEKEILAIDNYYFLISLLLSTNNIPEAIEVLHHVNEVFSKEEQINNIHKNYLYILILNLHTGSDETFDLNVNTFINSHQSFSISDEYNFATSLYSAVHSDQKTYDAFLKANIHYIREPCFARILKNMKLIEYNKNAVHPLDEILDAQNKPSSIVPLNEVTVEDISDLI